MSCTVPTAEQVGLDQLAYARFCKDFKFVIGAAASQASLADHEAACLMGRFKSDFGIWLQLPSHSVYCRLKQAVQHSRSCSVAAGQFKPPIGRLPEAKVTRYPPCLRPTFEREQGMGRPTARAVVEQLEREKSCPNLISSVLFVEDHAAARVLAHPLLRPTASAAAVRRSCALAVSRLRRCLSVVFRLSHVAQLHHTADPWVDGVYEPFVSQGKGGRAKSVPLTDAKCCLLPFHYVHDCPSVPLLVTSHSHQGRAELLYIPEWLKHADVWEKYLSEKEIKNVNSIAKSCTSVAGLLSHRLNEHFTVVEAIAALANNSANWKHGCVHLRWSVHCVAECAAIHKFAGARKKKRDSNGDVVDRGAVGLVYSNPGPDNGPKAAFLCWVHPLAKVAQAALLALPAGHLPPVLPAVWRGLELLAGLDGIACSYVSLNIFWSAGLSPRLPKKWREKTTKRQLGKQHAGLYLHRDQNNDKWGAVLVWGAGIIGFNQRYVTLALQLPTPGWSLIIGDFEHLLHCVTAGSGLRFSLVIASHKSTTQGLDNVGREVWAPTGEAE